MADGLHMHGVFATVALVGRSVCNRFQHYGVGSTEGYLDTNPHGGVNMTQHTDVRGVDSRVVGHVTHEYAHPHQVPGR